MELLPLVVESSIEMPWSLQEHPYCRRLILAMKLGWLSHVIQPCRFHNAMSKTNSCDPVATPDSYNFLQPQTNSWFSIRPDLRRAPPAREARPCR